MHAIGTTSLYELGEQQAKALIRGTPGPGVTLWIARAQAHLESTPRNINPEAQVRLKHTSLSVFTPGSTALESGLNVCVSHLCVCLCPCPCLCVCLCVCVKRET